MNYPKRKKILNWHDLVPWFFPGSCIWWLPTLLQGHQYTFLLGQWKWIWQNLIPWNLEMVFWICCWWLWLAEIKIYLHQPRFFYADSNPRFFSLLFMCFLFVLTIDTFLLLSHSSPIAVPTVPIVVPTVPMVPIVVPTVLYPPKIFLLRLQINFTW